MAITVKHNKVSTIPDTDDTSLVRPSDWNADHTLVGTIDVANGGTGASTLTGYVKGNGTSAMTAVATVPSTDITGLGTMSTQNANAVAITGGTINGTTIGATTPSSVNATTITGQTGRLNGTGQNFLLQSQTFNTSWTTSATTLTGSQSDPLGGSTAFKLTASATTAQHFLFQFLPSANAINGATYTVSIFAKPAGYNFLHLQHGNSGQGAYFNLSTGVVVSNGSGITSTITAAGNGYYRCSITNTLSSASYLVNVFPSPDGINNSYTGDGTSGILIWGSQAEFGTVTNTYNVTTTSIVYGTPTLSFSGVSTIGLESNGALFVQPAGTGALQAQATTSTTAGGNARGANAVDLQTSRSSATAVASGQYSFIGGGNANAATSTGCVSMGLGNGASGFGAATLSGNSNSCSSVYAVVTGGQNNVCSAYLGMIGGGKSNTAAGYFNFIGGGFTNSGTSGSAVTTQSGTMNATTAVTLSGSNANIKVGQYITGTSIGDDTYVAAISGTSLTLSKVASGSSTSTLSFFTPHGVVVGGGNNQATGSYSFIGGGGDAGTAANRNVASGDFSFVGGGRSNTASGVASAILGGGTDGSGTLSNLASGIGSVVIGSATTASGDYSIGFGRGALSSGSRSFAFGQSSTTRGIVANTVFSASNFPISATAGVQQTALLVLGRETTDATATALTSNSSAAGTTNQVILPNNSAYFFRGEVISGKTAGGDTKGWTIEGVIKRGANAAATTLVGSTVVSTFGDAGAATWTIALTADTTNGGLRVTFTGQAATTIRTVCQIRTTEMTF